MSWHEVESSTDSSVIVFGLFFPSSVWISGSRPTYLFVIGADMPCYLLLFLQLWYSVVVIVVPHSGARSIWATDEFANRSVELENAIKSSWGVGGREVATWLWQWEYKDERYLILVNTPSMCCHFVILPKGTLAMQIAGHPEALKKKKGRILPNHLIVLRQEYPSHPLIWIPIQGIVFWRIRGSAALIPGSNVACSACLWPPRPHLSSRHLQLPTIVLNL